MTSTFSENPDGTITTLVTSVEYQTTLGVNASYVLRADRGDRFEEHPDRFVLTQGKTGQVITVYKQALASSSFLSKTITVKPEKDAAETALDKALAGSGGTTSTPLSGVSAH